MAEWLVRVPGEPERVVPVPPSAKTFVVGRAEGCDLVIAEKKASKRHLELSRLPGADGGWVVADLTTSNGSFVGEHRVLRAVIADGDVVRIGDSTMQFRAGAPVPAVAA